MAPSTEEANPEWRARKNAEAQSAPSRTKHGGSESRRESVEERRSSSPRQAEPSTEEANPE
ncbi:hypothetical protein, partial [Paenibacillus durus]